MEILKESTGYLEEKINSTRKDINTIKNGLDNTKGQIKGANQQLSNIDFQRQDIKERMNFKRNILIGSLFGAGSLVIGLTQLKFPGLNSMGILNMRL